MQSENLTDRLEQIRGRIARAAGKSGRDPDSIRLIAVSKTHPAESIRQLMGLGQLDFAENRVQEFLGKFAELGTEPRWHFIGHLQRNKVKQIVGKVDLIHSVDSVRLIEELNRRAGDAGIVQPILIEINVSDDPAKTGASAAELPELAGAAIQSQSLELQGLMTIPAWNDDPEVSREPFARLRALTETLPSRAGGGAWKLSMGMSHDFEVAIEEGATMIRVGSDLFGPRV